MSSLREDLLERESADLVAILDRPVDRADADLAAMWQDVLRRRDPVESLGNAVLWCSLQALCGAVAECVRLIADREPLTRTLETLERYSHGAVTLEDVWRVTEATKGHLADATSEAVVRAGEAAGGGWAGFDDEALCSAGEAVTAVIAIGGEPLRDAVVEILRRRLPVPTVAAFHAAHAERYA